jgi:hypothetical protein
MRKIETPQTYCRAAMGQIDITPPLGIYHRMWGAARHDVAASVHRPLTGTMLWLAPADGDVKQSIVIISMDHCILDAADLALMQLEVGKALNIPDSQVLICLTHTHAAGLMSRTRSDSAGGDKIGTYLDSITERLAELATNLKSRMVDATILYGNGRCKLAAERDYWDCESKRFVCGYNPLGLADDLVQIASIVGESGTCLGTIVNYACHPTTLAWDNQAISPDYVGATREIVQTQTKAPCLFLQGASGDLGPVQGFVGDPGVADRNGRMLGFAALSTLESLPPARSQYEYRGAVVSGTHIGTWDYRQASDLQNESAKKWSVQSLVAQLPYRHDLLPIEEAREQLRDWRQRECSALEIGDSKQHSYCRAMAEQAQRQVWRQELLPVGNCFPIHVTLLQLGQSWWLFVPGEHYQFLQTSLRERFPDQPWLISTICNGWQPGYVPPASKYGYAIYQEQIAVTGPGSAEIVIETVARAVTANDDT